MPRPVFMEAVWDAKEAVPFALRNFCENQLKDLKRADIMELFHLLKVPLSLSILTCAILIPNR